MPELRLQPGTGWGFLLAVELPCGHRGAVLTEWVGPDGFIGRLSCTADPCSREFEGVVLVGWPGGVQ